MRSAVRSRSRFKTTAVKTKQQVCLDLLKYGDRLAATQRLRLPGRGREEARSHVRIGEAQREPRRYRIVDTGLVAMAETLVCLKAEEWV